MRLKKWSYDFLFDLHDVEKLKLLKHRGTLTNFNIMDDKPTEKEIIRAAELSSRNCRRLEFKKSVEKYSRLPDLVAEFGRFEDQMTNNGEVDINDLPVKKRLWFTKEGVNCLARTWTQYKGTESMSTMSENITSYTHKSK